MQADNKGRKNDSDKVRLDLIPPDAWWLLGKVLTFGAKKYEAHNWARGMDWSRVYGALQRHLNAWWGGEGRDEETGISHLGHALCCLVFLCVYEKRGIGKDDRWVPETQIPIGPSDPCHVMGDK